ncbi:MAG: GNAT family N-acetyltransferase [bacterium]|nr:GNAT family N-acetyltransferase [bacterium]
MNTIIRSARPEDVPQLVTIFHKTWLETYPNAEHGITVDDIEDKFEDSYSAERFEKMSAHIRQLPTNEKYLVAETDGKIVGLARLVKKDEHNALQAIYVLPEYQGKGIGTMLWKEGRKGFESSKDFVVDVAEYNSEAISFYKSLGFEETGMSFTEERHRMKSGAIIPETRLLLRRG